MSGFPFLPWRGLQRLVFWAFVVRVLLALVLEVTGYSRVFAPDEETYQRVGLHIASYWAGDTRERPWRLDATMPLAYFYINAFFFYVFGPTVVPVKLANAIVGAIVVVPAYHLTRDLFNESIARRLAILTAFFPSLVLWSAVNVRDAWVILLMVMVARLTYLALARSLLLPGLGLLSALLAITQFRDYLFLVVSLPVVAAFVVGRPGHLGRNVALAVAVSVVLVSLSTSRSVTGRYGNRPDLETVNSLRKGMATGDSMFAPDVDVSTPENALRFLPTGLAYFFFSPFPWQIQSLLRAVALPEMLLLYFLTPAMVRGVRTVVRVRLRACVHVLLTVVLLAVSYGLGAGNMGTLYRHRAQAMIFLLMLASVGLEVRRTSEATGPSPTAAEPAE